MPFAIITILIDLIVVLGTVVYFLAVREHELYFSMYLSAWGKGYYKRSIWSCKSEQTRLNQFIPKVNRSCGWTGRKRKSEILLVLKPYLGTLKDTWHL